MSALSLWRRVGRIWRVALLVGFIAPTGPVNAVCPFWRHVRSKPAPLMAGLRGSVDEKATAFDRRLQRRFPLGSAESGLKAELVREGFSTADPIGSTDRTHRYLRREDTAGWDYGGDVRWRTDDRGRLVSLRGRYVREGCL